MSGEMITGGFDRQLEALQRGMDQFRESTQKRIAKAMLTAGMRVVTKAIKGEIPGKFKEIRPLIGYRLLRTAVGDTLAGKVGAAVGKRSKSKLAKAAAKAEGRGNRPGVGISAENLHWFILGTGDRFAGQKINRDRKTGKVRGISSTGHPVQFRGRMPPQVPGVVQRGVAKSYKSALRKMAETGEKRIEAEAAKLRAAVARHL